MKKRADDRGSPAETADMTGLTSVMEWYRGNLCGRCMRSCMEKNQEVSRCERDCSEILHRMTSEIGVAFAADILIQDGYIEKYECQGADVAVQLDPSFLNDSESHDGEGKWTGRPGTDNGGMMFSLRRLAPFTQGRATSKTRPFNVMHGVQGVVRQAAKYLGSPSQPRGNLAGTRGALRGVRGRL